MTQIIDEILNKNVTLVMSNGSVLEGYVSEVGSKYCRLVELNNNVVIFSQDYISFVRLGLSIDIPEENPKPKEQLPPTQHFIIRKPQPKIEDLSMPNTPLDSTEQLYSAPSFVRKTNVVEK